MNYLMPARQPSRISRAPAAEDDLPALYEHDPSGPRTGIRVSRSPTGGSAASSGGRALPATEDCRRDFAAHLLLGLPKSGAPPVSTAALGDTFRLDLDQQSNLLWSTLLDLERRGLVQSVRRHAWQRTSVITQVLATLPAHPEEPMTTRCLGALLGLNGWQRADTLLPALDYLSCCGVIEHLHRDGTGQRWRLAPAADRWYVRPAWLSFPRSASPPAASEPDPAVQAGRPAWHTFVDVRRR